jgi:hypothetical protein
MKNPKKPTTGRGLTKAWKKIRIAKRKIKELRRQERKKQKHKELLKNHKLQKSRSYMEGLHTV